MKCPGCEYELWNLRAGPCPECGRPFKPSEFDFLANAVKFCCPHCSQTYYGTGEKGELVPGAFDCVSCGKPLTTDDMLLLPADALGKREATRFPNPWLDPHARGMSRWFSTVGASLGQPGKLMEATPAFGSTGRSLTYAMTNIVVASLSGLFCAGVSLFLPGGGAGGVASFVGASLLVPAIYLFVWAAATHGMLKLLRADTPDGMGRTVQAIAFGSGGWIMAIIPCFGPLVGFPAWVVCATLAVRAAHQTTGWRASIATLTLPVLTVLTIIGLYLALMFGSIYAAHRMTNVATQHAWASGTHLDWETVELANELRDSVQAGAPPAHGAALLGPNSPVIFTVFGDSQNYDAAIGPHTAMSLDGMDDASRAAALSAITSSWPANVTAHRIGNIVFTHHGVKPTDDPRLWLLIELPAHAGDPMADAVQLNGVSTFNARSAAQNSLDHQNRLRIAAGLPPLPDYQTLTASDGPWTAADGVAPPPP